MPVPDGVACGGDFSVGPMPVFDAPKTWQLGVESAEWERLIDNPYEEIFVPCGLSVDGVSYDQDCKVRIRGGSSRDYPKKSFRVTYPKKTEHPGYRRKINLRAEYNDPSYLRSILGNLAFTRFTDIPISRIQPLFLQVNGEDYGLMMQIERIGEGFIKDHGREQDELYEADPPSELHSTGGGSLIPLPDAALYAEAYQKQVGEETGHDRLIALVESLADDFDSGGTSYRSSVDVAEVLDYLAVMAVIQNQDHVRKNYYISPQPNGWEIYPWDLDLSFGCLFDGERDTTICRNFSADETPAVGVMPSGVRPAFPMAGPFNLLITLIMSDPDLADGFRCRACRIVESDAWQTELGSQIDELVVLLEPYVLRDDRDLNVDVDEWRAAVDEVRSFPARRAESIKASLGCSAAP